MRHQRLFAGAWLGLGLWAGACSGTHEQPAERTAAAQQPAARPVLNVPALVGASIDELERQLGPLQAVPRLADPAALLPVRPGDDFDAMGAFARPPLLLVVTYSTRTRQVGDLLVVGRNEPLLMQQAQLAVTAPTYLVLPVFQTDKAAQLLGLRIIARPLVQ